MRACLCLAAVPALAAQSAWAGELLVNRSFETAMTPATVNGNNFYTTMPNWVTTSDTGVAQPVNLVRPHAGYAGNPTATPTGGGAIYFDVNASSGNIRQAVTLPSNGMVDFSGWFSVRDNQQALSGCIVNIRDAGGTVVATVSTSFLASDPIGLWKQAAGINVPLAAGTYTFEAVIPNPANFDLASLFFKPALVVTKAQAAYSDPVNNLINPKQIPGGVTTYTITATSPAEYATTSGTVIVSDATPANTDLVLTDIVAGQGPASFAPGTSGLTYTYANLASAADNLEFSSNGGTSWTYTPVPVGGIDPLVTNVRLRPTGAMAASTSFTVTLRYRVR